MKNSTGIKLRFGFAALAASVALVAAFALAAIAPGVTETAFADPTLNTTGDRMANVAVDETDGAYGYHYVESPIKERVPAELMESELGLQGSLPSYYNSYAYGNMPAIRDQNPYGTCWAHSVTCATESSLISKGLASTTIDLSERHLAYFFYNKYGIGDPFGYLTYDYNTAEDDTYLDEGNNDWFAMWAPLTWMGAVNESQAPYSTLVDNYDLYDYNYSSFRSKTDLNDNLCFTQAKSHLQNVRIISMTDIDAVKEAIYTYGAVSSCYYHNDSYYSSYYNSYYDPNNQQTNHAISVVGWDDDFSRYNFDRTPSGDGAWLIRNSWGVDGYDECGYFWMSYYSLCFTSGYSDAFVYIADSGTNYAHNYQYDGSADAVSLTIDDGDAFGNVYVASGNPSGDEELAAVGFGIYTDSVNYEIQIYTDLQNSYDPTSGTPCLSSPQTGRTTYAGYYTIPLNQKVRLREGQTFSVVISFDAAYGSQVSIPMAYTESANWISFHEYTESGQSFYSEYGSWYDCCDEFDACARIKAYTNNVAKDYISIADAQFSSIPDQRYTGSAVTPHPTLTLYGQTLVENVDYSLSYRNNIRIGTATITATGMGNYTGSVSTTFRIVEKPPVPDPYADYELYWMFDDVYGHWVTQEPDPYGSYLGQAVAQELMSGYRGTRLFGPDDPIKRQDVATILFRYACSENPSLINSYGSTTDPNYYSWDTVFRDCPGGQYFTAAITWARDAGVFKGDGSTGYTTVRPGDNISREELALVLYRFAVSNGADPTGDSYSSYSGAPDSYAVSNWASDGVGWCYYNWIMRGESTTGRLNPQGTATRAAMAKMVICTLDTIR